MRQECHFCGHEFLDGQRHTFCTDCRALPDEVIGGTVGVYQYIDALRLAGRDQDADRLMQVFPVQLCGAA